MARAPGIDLGLAYRHATTTVLDHAATHPRQTRFLRRRPRQIVWDHCVIVHVGHGATAVPVHVERHHTHHDGLVVHHEVAPDQFVAQFRLQEGGLYRSAGDDHVSRVHGAFDSVRADVIDAGGPPPLGADA